MICAEGRAVHSVAMDKRSDKAGGRQTQTRRAGPVWFNARGSYLDRAASTLFVSFLDLEPNWLRQKAPI